MLQLLLTGIFSFHTDSKVTSTHSQFNIVLYKTLGSMMTFEIWAADCTVLAVQAVAALLSQVKIVRLSYILKSSNLSALMRSPL